MQRRISPHGCTPNSSRNRPLLPPLSAAVTIDVTSRSFNAFTRLSPASTRDCPAPPPMLTTFLLIPCFIHLSRAVRVDGVNYHPWHPTKRYQGQPVPPITCLRRTLGTRRPK